MPYTFLVSIYMIALGLCLQGCSTIYRYDTSGNLTCVDVGVLSSSTFAVPPPTITFGGEAFGCPRVVTVDIAAPSSISSVRYTRDGSAPTAASPRYASSFSAELLKGSTLTVQAIAVDQCGAVSQVVTQPLNCIGDIRKTPVIKHWFDLPLPWPGKKPYDDVVFENAELPQGCTVTGIQVELINPDGSRFGDPAGPETDEATDGNTGASLKSHSPLNSSRLELKVNSWHLFGYAVRYDVVYFVRGTNCVLPPFKYTTQ